MRLTPMHIETLQYISSNDYARPGQHRPELERHVKELRENGYLEVKCIGDRAKLCLTLPAQSLIASIAR